MENEKKMSKKKKVIIIVATILLVSIFVAIWYTLPQNVMKRRMDAFDQLYQFYVENGVHDRLSDRHKDNASYYHQKCDELHEKCGLDSGYYKYSEYLMDEAFVETYIQKNSVESFINKLYFIYKNCDDHCSSSYDFCHYSVINDVLDMALQIGQIEVIPFAIPEEGTEGYYTEHPDEVPEDREWTESGRFYTATGENVRTETRPCNSKVTVHGDFLVTHVQEYVYDEGAYGWENGEFIDRLPSFDYRVYDIIEYKGRTIYDDIENASAFQLDDTIYLLYGEEECFSDQHKIRPWDPLDEPYNPYSANAPRIIESSSGPIATE